MNDEAVAGGDKPALRLFVAMPGTNLGVDASWKNPEDVKFFFGKVRDALAERLSRDVHLIIEKEKRSGGVIHDSMFREAYEADVYVADLTGNNPNVFLELGVRYALRRGVTVIVSQNTQSIPFNVESLRAVQYANRPDEMAIRDIVDFIKAGLLDMDHCDSPVMSALDLAVVPRERWEEAARTRVDELVGAARRQEDLEQRLALLRRAVDADPLSVMARTQLVRELRLAERYTEALETLHGGIGLDPSRSIFFQERGLCYGRLGRVAEAVEALREAVRLDPDNTNTRSSLGGALRRLALTNAPQEYDRATLLESLGQYEAAYAIDHHDTYSGLNVAKTKLLLSRWDSHRYAEARKLFGMLTHLCAFESADAPGDYWRLFDLADTQLFQGKTKPASLTYTAAIEQIPVTQRSDVLRSPLSSLSELAEAEVLKGREKGGAAEIIELLNTEISRSRSL